MQAFIIALCARGVFIPIQSYNELSCMADIRLYFYCCVQKISADISHIFPCIYNIALFLYIDLKTKITLLIFVIRNIIA